MRGGKWSLLRPILPKLLLSIILGLFCNLSVVGLMACSAYLVTSAALHTPLYKLTLVITAVRTCGIFRAVFRYCERYVSHTAAFKVWGQLRTVIYKKVIEALPFSRNKLHDGDVFSIVLDSLDELRDDLLRLFLPPVGGLLLTMAMFSFLLPYSGIAAWIFAGAFIVIALLLPFIFCPRRRKNKPSLQVNLYEFIDGAVDMAVFDYAKRQEEIACQKIDTIAMNSTFLCTDLAETFAQVIAGIAVTAILAVFIQLNIDAVSSAVLLLAVLAAFEVIMPLAGLGTQGEQAVEAVRRLRLLLQPHNHELPAPVKDIAIRDDSLLTVHDMAFGYGEEELFNELHFTLRKGQKAALIGSSGMGKSTIVNLLVRLLVYDSGAIFWQNTIYNNISEEQIRQEIKTAMQEQYIFSSSIRENFQLLYPTITDKEIYVSLEAAGLAQFIRTKGQGLATKTGRAGRYLSGGQRKRLVIALALAKKSQLLILDEPTAGLDVLTASAIIDTIMKLNRTVLIITHDLSRIFCCDKLFILNDGSIIEQGTADQLANQNGLFSQMLSYRNIV